MLVNAEFITGCSLGVEFYEDEQANYIIIDVLVLRILLTSIKKE
jgi:hypothetical protein